MMKISLKKRIENVCSINDIFPVLRMPIDEFYRDAAFISKKRYLTWVYKNMELENWKDVNPRPDIAQVIKMSNELIESGVEEWLDEFLLLKDLEEKTQVEKGYEIMYQVMIEPFYELYQEKCDE